MDSIPIATSLGRGDWRAASTSLPLRRTPIGISSVQAASGGSIAMRCRRGPATFIVAVLVAVAALAAPALAEKRVALVIGNGAYQNAPRLPNPGNDAQDVAAALRRVGFEAILGLDLDRAGIDDHAVRFARA